MGRVVCPCAWNIVRIRVVTLYSCRRAIAVPHRAQSIVRSCKEGRCRQLLRLLWHAPKSSQSRGLHQSRHRYLLRLISSHMNPIRASDLAVHHNMSRQGVLLLLLSYYSTSTRIFFLALFCCCYRV